MAGADTVEYPCAIHLIRLNTTNDIIAALEVFIDSGAQKMIMSTCEKRSRRPFPRFDYFVLQLGGASLRKPTDRNNKPDYYCCVGRVLLIVALRS